MADKTININEYMNKKDLELILEVNKKAIEVETEVADQNEEILEFLSKNDKSNDSIDEKLDKIIKQNEELSKDIFKMQILFITGLISLVVQIIQIFMKH